jgi:amino acid transporter
MFSMFVTNLNVWSRMLFTLSRDRLLPIAFSRVDRTTRTPAIALLIGAAIDIVLQISIVETNHANKGIYSLVCALNGYWVTLTYIVICIAMVTYLFRIRQLRWWHLVLGTVGALPLSYSIIASAVPMPAFPDNIAVYAFVGGLVLVGGELAFLAKHRSTRLHRVGSSVNEDTASSPITLSMVATLDQEHKLPLVFAHSGTANSACNAQVLRR